MPKTKDPPILFMMIGIPCSGKSEYANTIINTLQGNQKPNVYSSDKIREELFGNINDQTHNHDLFLEIHRRIKSDLKNGKSAIYDATNLSKTRRISFLNELKNIRCTKCACVMLTPYQVCVERNKTRSRKVPDDVMHRMYLGWQPPYYHEGFDHISLIVSNLDRIRDPEQLFDDLSHINNRDGYSVGEHCYRAFIYASDEFKSRNELHFAAAFHDIGKEFVKHGDYNCDTYQSVSAYDSIFYYLRMIFRNEKHSSILISDKHNKSCLCQRLLYISNLIYFHTRPMGSWNMSEYIMKRDEKLVGLEMFEDIMRLSEADEYANIRF